MLWFPGSPGAKPARNFRSFISFFYFSLPPLFLFLPPLSFCISSLLENGRCLSLRLLPSLLKQSCILGRHCLGRAALG